MRRIEKSNVVVKEPMICCQYENNTPERNPTMIAAQPPAGVLIGTKNAIRKSTLSGAVKNKPIRKPASNKFLAGT